MPRPREPIALIQAKGRKNLTKKEIEERTASEVKPCADEIAPPSFLTSTQKKLFDKLAWQLQKIKIMGETDVDTLARYVVAQGLYEQAVKDLRAARKSQPKGGDVTTAAMADWASMMEQLDRRQDRYFKQAHTCASALGLTITSRCKLEVPVSEESPKVNKFSRFGVVGK